MGESGTEKVRKQAKKRGRRTPYTGGDWAIGACKPYRAPHTLSEIELAQRRHEVLTHWLPIAEARAAEGRKWYPGMVAWYQRELTEIDALLEEAATQKRQRRKRAA